jgi:hypothetical protein
MTLRIRSMVMRAFLALPFQIRQCSRSIGSTISSFAAARSGVSSTNPLAASFACCRRIAMWNQSGIGGFVTPASVKIERKPEQPSVNAVSRMLQVRPIVPRVRPISAGTSVSRFATAPNTCRPAGQLMPGAVPPQREQSHCESRNRTASRSDGGASP